MQKKPKTQVTEPPRHFVSLCALCVLCGSISTTEHTESTERDKKQTGVAIFFGFPKQHIANLNCVSERRDLKY